MPIEDGLVGGIVAGDRTGVAERQCRARLGAPCLEHDHGNVALRRFGERRRELARRAHRLEEETDHAGRDLLERVIQVLGR